MSKENVILRMLIIDICLFIFLLIMYIACLYLKVDIYVITNFTAGCVLGICVFMLLFITQMLIVHVINEDI